MSLPSNKLNLRAVGNEAQRQEAVKDAEELFIEIWC